MYKQIVDRRLLVKRLNVCASHIVRNQDIVEKEQVVQYDLFSDASVLDEQRKKEKRFIEREAKEQKALIEIKKKYGKNEVFKGNNLEDGATGLMRNGQIGGHKG